MNDKLDLFFSLSTSKYHQGVQYLCIQAADSPTQNLVQFFSQSNDFIHRCRFILRENGDSGSVLVHCLAGVSRSVTLLVAYLM